MLAAELKIEDRVHMVNAIDDKELAALYRGSIGLVFPSFYEGFGFPVLEAFGCGTPCVVANVASLPEVAGTLGILVSPEHYSEIAQGMIRMMTDADLRKRVRLEGPEVAARFSWDTTAATVWHTYERLLNASPSSPTYGDRVLI
jgi:glycosyltransferase involved in cell wall biosynthesis